MYIMHKKCEESCEKALLVIILPKCHLTTSTLTKNVWKECIYILNLFIREI